MIVRVLGYWAVEAFGESTSFLIESEGNKILLDTSPGVCRELNKANIKMTDIDAILLSHVHGDHLLGFPYAIFTRKVQARSLAQDIPPIVVISNKETINSARDLINACYPERNDLIFQTKVTHEDYTEIIIGDISIKSMRVDHTVPTLAFRIESDGKSIGCTGDTRPLGGLSKFLSGVDLLMVEAFGTRKQFEKIAEVQKHLLADEAGIIANEAGVDRIMPYHFHLPYKNTKEMDELISELKESYKKEIIIPADQLSVEI